MIPHVLNNGCDRWQEMSPVKHVHPHFILESTFTFIRVEMCLRPEGRKPQKHKASFKALRTWKYKQGHCKVKIYCITS